jgi:hypothetical protein
MMHMKVVCLISACAAGFLTASVEEFGQLKNIGNMLMLLKFVRP